MTGKSEIGARWLTVGEASDILSVSPSTLRRWTTNELIPVRVTAGGHRRYKREVIEAIAQTFNATTPSGTSLARQPVVRSPVEWGVLEDRLRAQRWYGRFANSESVASMRALGQRLLGLLIQQVSRSQEDPRFLYEAREVGVMQGRLIAKRGATFREVVEAFLFFRNSLSSVVLQVPYTARSSDGEEIIKLVQVVERFMDSVLAGIAEGYEVARGNLPAPTLLDKTRGN